ncbi:carboxylate-amine ligase [Glutamicibacter uratoxydans]|uniref:carboxylate-amine ligase n=1 Tax=Glutamicibacter uratoxydans TaxID=43667 RepID=UPI003D6DFB1B
MSTFGIEEEFFIFDAETGMPAQPRHDPFQELLAAQRAGQVQQELLACQIEYASTVCQDRTEALSELRNFRMALAYHAERENLRVAGLGSAPMIPHQAPVLTDNQRYHEIGEFLSGITDEHYMCGLHIHVSIPDREAGVKALNFLRPWLPLLCALAANSPYWHGTDSKFSSWRTIHYRKWSVQGIPPHFGDAADYESRLARLASAEAVPDLGHIGWGIRLSENYPTIELRVADSQMRAHDSVLLAVLTRALVDTAIESITPEEPFYPEMLDLALWQAAKNGVHANQLDPRNGATISTRDLARRLLKLTEPALRESKDYDFAVHSLRNLLETGNGAVRQRAAFARGSISHLLENAHAEMQM